MFTTTAKLNEGDIVRFGNKYTGYRFATIVKKEKSIKPRWYSITLYYHSVGNATEAFACNTEFVKVSA